LVNFEQEMKSTKTFEKFNHKFHSQVFKPSNYYKFFILSFLIFTISKVDGYLIELNRINKDPSSAVIDAVSIKVLKLRSFIITLTFM
jgi:hypothetical protein